jgi:type I restriction enzyme, S subunit
MKKYDSYKDSGVEWIGEIPKHWSIKRLKRFAQICNGQDQKNVLDENGIYPIYGTGGVFGYANTFLYDKVSVLLGRKGTIDKPQYVKEPFWSVDTAYYTIINNKTNPRFFYYLCTTINFELYKYGSAVPSMSQMVLNEIPFCCPELIEQIAISNYLDHKTTQIDNLISKKERLIELLQEERTAIINQAVTKGLDPNVPMKDSGIEWLGEIPEHWVAKKLKFVFELKDSIRVPLSSEERGLMTIKSYDYYGASGIIDKVDEFLFDEDLILIGEDGANLLSRSTRLAFIAKGKYWVNNHAHILKPKSGNIDYLCELLELIDYTKWISGSAQPKLTQEALMSIEIFEPPISEQNNIAEFINNQYLKTGIINDKLSKELELLKEYKTALISEVVTGKVDVRDEVI